VYLLTCKVFFFFDPERYPQGEEDHALAEAFNSLRESFRSNPMSFCEDMHRLVSFFIVGSSADTVTAKVHLSGPLVDKVQDDLSLQKRMQSFNGWPRSDFSVTRLAEAGFVYAPIPGKDDRSSRRCPASRGQGASAENAASSCSTGSLETSHGLIQSRQV
jgi:hypothetical protein